MNIENIKFEIDSIVSNSELSKEQKLQKICNHLKENVDHYDWVGYYFANHKTKTLHLGPFSGTPTDHIEIPFGRGICGQVAVSNQNFVVPDVATQDNYIACSLNVKSEIVVPLFVGGVNIGQIDVDSNKLNPFTIEDENLLEYVNQKVAKLF